MANVWRISLALTSLALFGCGESPVHIADQVFFRANFQQMKIQTRFQLNEDFAFKASYSSAYDGLGTTWIDWDAQKKLSFAGVEINANPYVLGQDWPTSSVRKLAGFYRLPKPFKAVHSIEEWTKSNLDLQVSLLFRNEESLSYGGSLSSSEFSLMPEGFFATQYFKNKNGDVLASISVLGPEEDFDGGIYYFSQVGMNPFEESDEIELSIPADEPAEISAKAKWSPQSWLDFLTAKKSLFQKIDNFE